MITKPGNDRITVENVDGSFGYDIVITDSFGLLAQELLKITDRTGRIGIITDSNVKPIYADEVKNALLGTFDEVYIYDFRAGEENKNLETVKGVYEFLIANRFERKDLIIALGGGVVGDLTGFAAATYLRGIPFVQIPTTLLSMVDSSVGGKTGVDFDSYKNMVGAFHMPSLVYTDISTLKTLPASQFASGMGEVIKAGLIKDGSFYGWIINNLYEIDEKDPEVIKTMIYNSCMIKRDVVQRDPFEKGERAILNLGHTIGHAIEKYRDFKLLHGECVALGTVAAAYISYKRQMLSFDEYYEIRDMFVPFDLPITVRDIEPEKILELTKNDKKMDKGRIRFILLKAIGKAVIDTTVTDEEILAGINEIYVSEEDLKE